MRRKLDLLHLADPTRIWEGVQSTKQTFARKGCNQATFNLADWGGQSSGQYAEDRMAFRHTATGVRNYRPDSHFITCDEVHRRPVAAVCGNNVQPKVTVVSSSTGWIKELSQNHRGATLLSLGCESYHVDHFRPIPIVKVSTPSRCLLFDTLDIDKSSEVFDFLKKVLEDEAITKIIHDRCPVFPAGH